MGGYQSPLPGMVTVNPVADIISGMLQGAQLHMQMQRAQDEHDAQLRQAAQQDRNNRIDDMLQTMKLNGVSRPVSPSGTVQDSPTTSLLGQMLGGDNGQPNPMGNLPVTLPGAIRKADSGRVVKYKDADGNTVSRELYTPEEQNQRAAAAKQMQTEAGMIDVPIPPALQAEYGGRTSIKALPGGVPGLIRDMNELSMQNETLDISPDDQETYGLQPQLKGRDAIKAFQAEKLRRLADKDAADRADKAAAARSAEDDKKLAAADKRQADREAEINKRAADREDQQKRGKIVGVNLKMSAALNQAEQAYRSQVNKLKLNTKLSDSDKAAQIGAAQKQLRDAKQTAQNAYEQDRAALGDAVPHYEYPTVEAAQAQAQPAAAAKAPAAPAAKFTEAEVRAKATAAGKDPDAVVKAARSKGLIQ